MAYTQNELTSIWKEIKENDDPYYLLDVSALAGTFMQAGTELETDVEQTLRFHTVSRYSNGNDSTTFRYIRRRLNNEALWGTWEANT